MSAKSTNVLKVLNVGKGLLWLLICSATLLYGCTNKPIVYPEGFYKFNIEQLDSILEKTGEANFSLWPHSVERNSLGTSLRLGSIKERKKVILSCDGSIDEIITPAPSAWINDENEIIAWHENTRTHYINEYTEEGNFIADHGTDPSGYFFWKRLNKKCGVFRINKPDSPILLIDGFRLRLFSSSNRLLIVAQKNRNIIDASIFRYDLSSVNKILEREIKISDDLKRQLWVTDYNFSTGDMVLLDVWDKPTRSKWYWYNINTMKLRKLGDAYDYGFFLKCDLISAVL